MKNNIMILLVSLLFLTGCSSTSVFKESLDLNPDVIYSEEEMKDGIYYLTEDAYHLILISTSIACENIDNSDLSLDEIKDKILIEMAIRTKKSKEQLNKDLKYLTAELNKIPAEVENLILSQICEEHFELNFQENRRYYRGSGDTGMNWDYRGYGVQETFSEFSSCEEINQGIIAGNLQGQNSICYKFLPTSDFFEISEVSAFSDGLVYNGSRGVDFYFYDWNGNIQFTNRAKEGYVYFPKFPLLNFRNNPFFIMIRYKGGSQFNVDYSFNIEEKYFDKLTSLKDIKLQGHTNHYYEFDYNYNEILKIKNFMIKKSDGSLYSGEAGVTFTIFEKDSTIYDGSYRGVINPVTIRADGNGRVNLDEVIEMDGYKSGSYVLQIRYNGGAIYDIYYSFDVEKKTYTGIGIKKEENK